MKIQKSINDKVKWLIGLTNQKTAINLRYFIEFKKLPNLKNPVTFNEKINAYKLKSGYDFTRLADKVAVKDYVAEKIGVEYVIPTLFAGEVLPSLAERNTWQMPYIIKMNHASGWNIMVRNEKERNWKVIEKQVNKWLKTTFGHDSGEIHYTKIKPMVLVEKFISEDVTSMPKDYKLFTFNGKTEFIEVVSDREHNHAACFYDTNWNKVNLTFSDAKSYRGDIPKPTNIDELISYAETLAQGFPFVRVDFYDVNGHIFFGEMTFFASAGFAKLTPKEYEKILGDKINL